MTKKHFIQLANVIRNNRTVFNDDSIDVLSSFCAAQNPMFKKQRWLMYINNECGPCGGKIKNK
jgi:hypothetical protein